jgi:hypothetical protein
VHQQDEVLREDKTQAVYNRSIARCNKVKQSCELNHNHGAIFVQAQIEKIDNLLMQNTILKTK